MAKKVAPPSKGKALVKKSSDTGVIPIDQKRPAYTKSEDVAPPVESGGFLPTLKLLQALSPEVDNSDDKFINGASQGDIVVVDGSGPTLFDGEEGVTIIPVCVRKLYNEWIPRKQGGGFVASYQSREEMEQHFERGHEMQVSIDYLCVTDEVNPEKKLTPVVVQFNSATKLGVARELAEKIKEFRTMTGVQYKISGLKKKNKAGQPYYNFKIVPMGWVPKDLYDQIQKIREENEEAFSSASLRTIDEGAADDKKSAF